MFANLPPLMDERGSGINLKKIFLGIISNVQICIKRPLFPASTPHVMGWIGGWICKKCLDRNGMKCPDLHRKYMIANLSST